MKKWPVLVAVVMIASTWGTLRTFSRAEPIVTKKPFATFPLGVGTAWQGKELGLDKQVLDVLGLDDYMMRVYTKNPLGTQQDAHGTISEQPVRVWLYVGYYQSQRTGSTYHSPKNCLPGSGWQFLESEHVSVLLRGVGLVRINKVVVQKQTDKQVILYWYQDRGRVVASEYYAKAYLVWDAMTKNRTDGALVRISVPVITTPEKAFGQGLAFVEDFWPLLQEYLPDGATRS